MEISKGSSKYSAGIEVSHFEVDEKDRLSREKVAAYELRGLSAFCYFYKIIGHLPLQRFAAELLHRKKDKNL